MNPRYGTMFSALAVALLAAGCGPIGPSTSGTQGELGNGLFSYGCDSDSDPVCDTGDGAHTMPKAVAVGSRFSVTYTPTSTAEDPQGSATVEPASKELLVQTETFGKSFKAIKPGLGALLARRGQTIVDLIHLRLGAVDHVQIDATRSGDSTTKEGISELVLGSGETAVLRATPVDEADELLGGALACAWTSDDSAVAKVTTIATDNQITVEGGSAGTTTMRLEMGDSKVDLAITVQAAGTGGAGGGGGATGSGGGGGTANGGAGGAGGGQ